MTSRKVESSWNTSTAPVTVPSAPAQRGSAHRDRDTMAGTVTKEHTDLTGLPVGDGPRQRATGLAQLPAGVIDVVEQVVLAPMPDDLRRAEPGELFRRRVPVGDPAVPVHGVDRLAHRLQEGRC